MLLLHDEIVVQVPRRATDAAAAWLESSMTLSFQGVPITAHVEQYGTHWAGPRDDDRLVEDEEEIEEESAA
jgi:DNA polymerase I-like protein with 3'-5' exonuclease and polymerase domains